MPESFKNILRSKTAEQLSNMYRNKESWSDDQYQFICEEVKNRELETFEEPTAWTDEEMEDVDIINPQTDFEKDMAYLTKEKENHRKNKGLSLASQIVSIASVFVGFSFFYLYWQSTMFWGVTSTILICLLAVSLGITSVVLHILKSYIAGLAIGGSSLLLSLVALLLNLQRLMQ